MHEKYLWNSNSNWKITPSEWRDGYGWYIHTFLSSSKQRWRLISLLRSLGRLRINVSSSAPLFSCHLYCSYLLMLSFSKSGSIRWDIHSSASLLLTLISSTLTLVDCRYFCNNNQHHEFKKYINHQGLSS